MSRRARASALAALGLASLLLPRGEALAPWLQSHCWHLCWIKALSGIDCPGCGMTRALLLAMQGYGELSLRFHPLGIPLLVLWAGSVAVPPKFLPSGLSTHRALPPLAGLAVVLATWAGRMILAA